MYRAAPVSACYCRMDLHSFDTRRVAQTYIAMFPVCYRCCVCNCTYALIPANIRASCEIAVGQVQQQVASVGHGTDKDFAHCKIPVSNALMYRFSASLGCGYRLTHTCTMRAQASRGCMESLFIWKDSSDSDFSAVRVLPCF